MTGADTAVRADRSTQRSGGRAAVALGVLVVGVVLLFGLAVATGSVVIPPGRTLSALLGVGTPDARLDLLVTDLRIPRAVTAGLAGAGLGTAGLLTQTLFRNPLAEPYVLGVSAGAGLGVALVTTVGAGAAAGAFAGGGLGGAPVAGRLGTVAAAALGAGLVLGLVLLLSRFAQSVAALLVIGVMLGSVITAVVSLLLVWTDPQTAQQYLLWGLASVDGVARAELPVLATIVGAGLLGVVLLAKPLDGLLLGDDYARTAGVDVARVRLAVLVVAAVLAGTVTAFCGPIGFLGIAVPHLARAAVGTSRHRILIPATALTGAVAGLACAVVAHPPGAGTVVPLNVVTSLVGAPVVIAVLLRSRRLGGRAW
ncbi:iron complex transport system permease protein [Pseudonocardia ammonioxydans]|uniref:Iron complex transport system permease protein n=1 Tax=Pseudonocardia ammonioxydans TaxID=260086 RepID=A0A1I4T498_PSUAM|nr:iron ABC transporter permease [Pseudonocardia ammonioxydans]SFM71455.1 iron complex transport system permease protein [Pseudonocardia ammonioxydans]